VLPELARGVNTLNSFTVRRQAFSDSRADFLSYGYRAEADRKITSFLYWGKVQGHTKTGSVTPANDPKAVAVKWRAVRDPILGLFFNLT
jgi:hypothetical protein